jgi:hypothetical protein
MIILSYIIVSLLLVAAGLGLSLLVRRSRRKGFEKANAEKIREANRPLRVWICRYCGFLSLMREEGCSGCGAPRPEDFIERTILRKDFQAQTRAGTGGGKAGKRSAGGSPDAGGPAEFRKVHPARRTGQ